MNYITTIDADPTGRYLYYIPALTAAANETAARSCNST